MIDIERPAYPYFEEVNDGALAQFPAAQAGERRSRVLDVGCGRGQLGEAIEARGYEVWGIESSEEAARCAAGRLTRVLQCDLLDVERVRSELENGQGQDPVKPIREAWPEPRTPTRQDVGRPQNDIRARALFDVLLFSDVLEHVCDPLATIRAYLPLLRDRGRVVISLPNVAAWEFRLRHLFGQFDYADTGVLDRTHLRFFTFRTAKALVRAAGCNIVGVDQTPHLVRAALPLFVRALVRKDNREHPDPRAIADSRSYKFYRRFVYPAEHWIASWWKGLLAFRIIVVAEKNG